MRATLKIHRTPLAARQRSRDRRSRNYRSKKYYSPNHRQPTRVQVYLQGSKITETTSPRLEGERLKGTNTEDQTQYQTKVRIYGKTKRKIERCMSSIYISVITKDNKNTWLLAHLALTWLLSHTS